MRLVPVLLTAVLLAGCTSAAAQSPPATVAPEGVSVTGIGRITGVPDVLRATLGVEVSRPTVQEALDAANESAARVLEALREAGVAEEDLQTRDLSVYPRYGEDGQQITGYTVLNLVEAALRDLDRAGDVLGQALEAAGDVARLQSVRFELEDNQALLDDARARAFAEARRTAEQYAELAGGSLGRLIRVDETGGSLPPPIAYGEAGAAADAARASVPIEPGTQEVAVQVNATWELQ